MAEPWNTDSGAGAHGIMIPLESTPLAFQALADYLETVAKGAPIVEDDQGERSALRALLDVYEDRVEEAENGAREIGPALDPRPEHRTTRILRAALGLLMAPLVVAGYAGLVALIMPIAVLRSVFGPWSPSAARRRASPRDGVSDGVSTAGTLGAVPGDRRPAATLPNSDMSSPVLVLVALIVSAIAIACGEETPSQQSTIIVASASYGRNCAPLATGNATNSVKVACDGKTACEYNIQTATLGPDPCVGTHKDFDYNWSCSGNSDLKSGRIPGEASGSSASLHCP